MKIFEVVLLLCTAAIASAQVINTTAIELIIDGYTSGSGGTPNDQYLTNLASTLTSGFVASMGNILPNISALQQDPSDWSGMFAAIDENFCIPAYVNQSVYVPATVTGPEVDIQFSAGACLIDENNLLSGANFMVDCIAPSISVTVTPAQITSPYTKSARFFDKNCAIKKTFGQASDNVVFVLENGLFNIPNLVSAMTTGLTSVLGQFSSLAGAVTSMDKASPIWDAIGDVAAVKLLG